MKYMKYVLNLKFLSSSLLNPVMNRYVSPSKFYFSVGMSIVYLKLIFTKLLSKHNLPKLARCFENDRSSRNKNQYH